MKSWRTTLVGCLLAVVLAVEPIISTGVIDWKRVILAALIAGFSFLVKDSVVTGGTVAQTKEAEQRNEATPDATKKV